MGVPGFLEEVPVEWMWILKDETRTGLCPSIYTLPGGFKESQPSPMNHRLRLPIGELPNPSSGTEVTQGDGRNERQKNLRK